MTDWHTSFFLLAIADPSICASMTLKAASRLDLPSCTVVISSTDSTPSAVFFFVVFMLAEGLGVVELGALDDSGLGGICVRLIKIVYYGDLLCVEKRDRG